MAECDFSKYAYNAECCPESFCPEHTERTLLIYNDQYALARIMEEDRAGYVELQRQLNGEGSLFLNPISRDMMWESAIDDNTLYVILDKNGGFCGSVELKNQESRTPEIGISLLEKCRNKGIARHAVSLLVELTYSPERIDYYLLRIDKDNLHSRHVFEKMGAVCLGDDLDTADAFKEYLDKGNWGEKQKSEVLAFFLKHEGNSNVVRYKLDPCSDGATSH